jgi:hypothetical protein
MDILVRLVPVVMYVAILGMMIRLVYQRKMTVKAFLFLLIPSIVGFAGPILIPFETAQTLAQIVMVIIILIYLAWYVRSRPGRTD